MAAVVPACWNTTVRVFDAATGAAVRPVLRHPTFVRDAAYSPDGARIATLASGGAVQVWDAATGDPLGPPLEAAQCTRGRVWFGRDGRRVLRLSPGLRVAQWDLPTFPAPAADVPTLVDLLTGQHVDAADSIDLLHEADILAHVAAYRAAWARRSGAVASR